MGQIKITKEEFFFNKVFKDEGGLFITSKFIKVFYQEASQHLSRAIQTWPEKANVNFNIINNPRIVASARIVAGQNYIGISYGTIMCMYVLFGRMLANPNILPQYGDVSKELAPDQLDDVHFVDFETSMENTGKICMPKDKERMQLVFFLTSICLRVVVIHEYAHISKGHIKFKLKYYNDKLQENFSKEQVDSMNLVLQGFELESDQLAIYGMMNEMITILANPQNISPGFKPLIKDIHNTTYLALFAMASFFRIYGLFKWEVKDINNLKHPPEPVRFKELHRQLVKYVKENVKEIRTEDLTQWYYDALFDVEDAFKEISKKPRDFEQFFKTGSPLVNIHINKILDELDKIRYLR